MLQFWFKLTWSDPRRLSMQEMHHGRNPCALTGHCFDTLDCNMEYTCTGYISKRVCLPAVRSDIVSIIYNMFQHRQRPCQTDSACFKILLLSMNELGVELFGAFLAEQAVFFVTRWKYLSDGTLCFAEGQMEAGTSTSSSAGGRPRRWPYSVFPRTTTLRELPTNMTSSLSSSLSAFASTGQRVWTPLMTSTVVATMYWKSFRERIHDFVALMKSFDPDGKFHNT